MARIVEYLTLNDDFSNTYKKYLGYTQQADTATSKLMGGIKSMAGAYLGLQGLKGLVGISDMMTQTTARLNMMNDGLQSTDELNKMIYQSAQRSRGAYQETADMVAKLGTLAGDAFSSSAEIVAFAEQLNKQMTLSGTSTVGTQAAMLQLTQAMSSGVLRGEELNSILEQTPMIAQTIADYMGVNTGTMREMASEGKITAEVVKNAMFAAADETNAKFEQMPMTWGQVWMSFKNTAVMAVQPVLNAVSWLANNIQIIGPLVLGAGAAFAVFQVAANWTKIASIATAAYNAVVTVLSIGYGILTGSTAAASAATFVFNSALLASPITWVVMGVMLLVGALYAGVAAFNHFSGASVSATGIITGAVYTMGAFVYNIIAEMWNQFAVFANFIGNVFNNPIAAIKIAFYDMAVTVLGFLQKIVGGLESVLNAIPGIEVSLTSGIDNLIGSLSSAAERTRDESGWKEYVKSMDYKDLTNSFKAGYEKGSNFSLFGETSGVGGYSYSDYDTLAGNVSGIKGDTGSIKKAVNMADEDIKSLVDIATRQYVNKINFNSQTPVITINGANTGNTAADRKAMADTLRDIILEQAAAMSSRSTARVEG